MTFACHIIFIHEKFNLTYFFYYEKIIKMTKIIKNNEYKVFIHQIKNQIQSSQIKASVSVNQELLKLYWNIAHLIIGKQKNSSWGDGLINEISKDLKEEFPDLKGFSKRNLELMRQWYLYWVSNNQIAKQAVSQLIDTEKKTLLSLPIFQIPWGHNIVIISKIKEKDEALFYIQQTIQNNWSRAVLVHQIELELFRRQGKAINNFEAQLPKAQSDLALQTLKDPYCFDFLMLRKKHDEKELENALIENITQFLLELGAGFSYLGKQVKLTI